MTGGLSGMTGGLSGMLALEVFSRGSANRFMSGSAIKSRSYELLEVFNRGLPSDIFNRGGAANRLMVYPMDFNSNLVCQRRNMVALRN